jgi:hypothetical protein
LTEKKSTLVIFVFREMIDQLSPRLLCILLDGFMYVCGFTSSSSPRINQSLLPDSNLLHQSSRILLLAFQEICLALAFALEEDIGGKCE